MRITIKNLTVGYDLRAWDRDLSPRARIPHFYRIYFLYFEPLAALGGTYLCLFNPTSFLTGTVPLPFLESNPSSLDISPLMQMILTNIGSLYVLLAIQEGIVLRLTREKKVWVAVILSMIATDLGHLYAAYVIAPERMRIGQVGDWSGEEWINYGTLMLGLTLRVLCLGWLGEFVIEIG